MVSSESDPSQEHKSWPHVPGPGGSSSFVMIPSEEEPEYRAKEKEEEQKKQEEKKQEQQGADSWQNKATIEGGQGYQSDVELGFDVVNHEQSEDISDEHELDPKRRKKRGFAKFLSLLKHAVLGVQRTLFKQPEKMMKMVAEKVNELAELISTYRHHSIVAPGDQAGIFDNKVEADKKAHVKAVEHAVEAVVVREVTHMVVAAEREIQHAATQAAKHAAQVAAKPIEHKIDQVKGVVAGAKDFAGRLESGVTITDMQGNALYGTGSDVSRSQLGTLSPHAAAALASKGVDGPGQGR